MTSPKHSLFWILCLIVTTAVAHENPLVALNFNEPTDAGEITNKGTLSGTALLEAEGLPKPSLEEGATGRANDKALTLAGEQMHIHENGNKFSRLRLPLKNGPDSLNEFTICFWFTISEKGSNFQRALLGWGTLPKDQSQGTGINLALNTSGNEKQPQFRVQVDGKAFYSPLFAKKFEEKWVFAAFVFRQGKMNIYTADKSSDTPTALSRNVEFPTENVKVPKEVLVGSFHSPFSNLVQHDGKIDNLLIYDRVLSEKELSKLFFLVVPQLP